MQRYQKLLAQAAALLLTAAACAAADSAELQGTWRLVEIASKPVDSRDIGQLPTFTITGNVIAGFDGCNTFQGRVDRPGSVAMTRRACPGNTLRLPVDLENPWAHLSSGSVADKKLTLPARKTLPASVFVRTD